MKKHLLFLLACLFLMTGTVMAKIVKGRVIDSSDKEPIVGASIFVKSTKQGTITDIEGHFSLEIPDNVKTITVSFVGMTTREVAITPGEMTIELTAESQALDEVVVVAYGTQKKSSITGAITQVRNEELLKRPVTSVTSALEGSTPGITVTGNYGSPGSDPTVLIRGIGTVNGSTSPLYVIDGVPYGGNISDLNMEDIETMSILKDAASAALYGNRASNGVILITTKKSKSERIQFNFKTNQGWYERALPEYERTNPFQFMEVEYQNAANAFVHGGGDRTDKQAILNAVNSTLIPDRLYVNIFNKPDDQLFTLDGKMAADASIIDGYAGDLDWFDQATRKGYRSEYQFSGSGATSKSDYYFSLSYLDENGYMKDSGFDRLTGRMAVNIKPVKWLRAGMSINASHQKFQNTSNGVGDGSSSYSNPFYFCRYMAPIYPVHSHYTETGTVYDNAGTPIQVNKGDYVLDGAGNPQWDGGSYIIYDQNGNPQEVITRNQNRDRHVIWESELNDSRTIRNTLNGIGYLDLVLPYGFTATLKANVNTRNSDYYKYENAVIGDARGTVSEDGSISGRNGALAKTLYTYKNWTLQEQLRWNMTYNDRHNIEVLLGHENYSYRYDYTYTSKTNEAFPNRYALSNFSEMASISGYKTRYRTESYLARVQYGYDNRYNIEASFRRDGSSRFGKKHRWGTFPSVSVAWRASQEKWFPKNDYINDLKVRAGYGVTGSQASVGNYSYLASYNTSVYPFGISSGNQTALVSSTLANPYIHWEEVAQTNIGFDASLFNSRVMFSFDAYLKETRDMLVKASIPITSGFEDTTTTYTNAGKVRNQGIEMSLHTINLTGELGWETNLTATYNKNKIKDLNSDVPYYINQINNSYVTMLAKDYPINVFYGYVTDGIFQNQSEVNTHAVQPGAEPGDIRFRDLNNDGVINDSDRTVIGNPNPSWLFSMNNSLSYKGFELSVFLQGIAGNKIYNANNIDNTGMAAAYNQTTDVLKRWQGEGTSNSMPRAVFGDPNQNTRVSDRFVENGSYLRLKNITLSYTFPKQWLQKAQIENARLSLSCENVATITGYSGFDPEVGINGIDQNRYPISRTFSLGLNFNF